MNDLTTCGLHIVNLTGSITNQPSGVTNWCVLEVFSRSTDQVQRLHSFNSSKVFERTYSGSTWSNWHEYSFDIPSFYKNYDSISGLASALGVWKDCGLTSETEYTSINDIQSGGIWTVNGKKGGGALSDIPTGESTGCLLYFKSTYSAQVFIPMVNTNVFYVRIKIGNNNWLSWVSFSAAV